MTHIKAISIPEPCHQSWQQMTESNNGRHCQHCCKTVVDFTSMSNDEIIAHLGNSSHVCGRFGQQQLGGLNYGLYAKNLPKANWWKRAAVFVGMLGPILSHRANAQVKQPIANAADPSQNANRSNYTLGKVVPRTMLTIHGKVTAKDDGLPLPGAVIKLKGTNIGVMADVSGRFTINVPGPESTLMISFVGYESQTIKVNDKTLDITLAVSSAMMGEVVIVKINPKPLKMWRIVKDKFCKHSELAADSDVMARLPYF